MSMESSQSKKRERWNKKVHTYTHRYTQKRQKAMIHQSGWIYVCSVFLDGQSCWVWNSGVRSPALSKLLVHIWGKYNLGARTWQTEGFHAMLPCQGTRAMSCWTQSWFLRLPHTKQVRGHINKRTCTVKVGINFDKCCSLKGGSAVKLN